MHDKYRYVWQLLDMNTCTRGVIFPQICCISPHNQTDLEQVSVEDSVSHILVQKWTVTSREFLPLAATPEFLVCRLRCSLFTGTPTEDLCQESVSRRTQSDECGTVLTPLLRFLGWDVQPVSTLVCILLHTVYTDCC